MEMQFVFHFLGDIEEVFLIFLGQDNRFNSGSVSSEYLFFYSANFENLSREGHLSSEGNLLFNLPFRQYGRKGGSYCNPGRRSIFGD